MRHLFTSMNVYKFVKSILNINIIFNCILCVMFTQKSHAILHQHNIIALCQCGLCHNKALKLVHTENKY